MKLVELDVLKFLDVVDSNSPAPGGGSVSALASSLGASLARMVAHLSFGKKNMKHCLMMLKLNLLQTLMNY